MDATFVGMVDGAAERVHFLAGCRSPTATPSLIEITSARLRSTASMIARAALMIVTPVSMTPFVMR